MIEILLLSAAICTLLIGWIAHRETTKYEKLKEQLSMDNKTICPRCCDWIVISHNLNEGKLSMRIWYD